MFELFFAHETEMYYVREITREINEEINAVRRELERMLGAGILKSEQRGNRLYYFVNTRYLFFQELQQMIIKTTGLGKKIRKYLRKLGTISFVMFSGRYAKGLAPRQGEVDILIVGEVVLPELTALVKEEEARIGREINYGVFSLQEFEFRKTRRDPFIMDVLFGSRVMVVGSDAEFSERKAPGL